VNILAKIWPKPLWVNILVTIVHGSLGKVAGHSPRRKMSFDDMIVATNSNKLVIMRMPTGFNLKPG